MSDPGRGVDRIRVLTYNLRDLKDDADAVARVVRAVQPDVACLQELPRHVLAGHRIGALADDCGLLWSGGGMPAGGTAVLTALRVDLRSAHAARLPVKGRLTRPRGFAAAVVAVPGGPVLTVASVHLSLVPEERQRHAQLVLDGVQATGPAPYVIAGDLNEPPDGPSWQVFGALVRDAAEGRPESGATYPARAPRQRIDAVLVSSGVTVESVRVADVGDGVDPADLLSATDHLPVIADLRIGPVS